MTQPSQPLGAILMRRGLVTQGQLERALQRQRESGAFLGVILVEQGILQPNMLLEVLSEQFGIPCDSITPADVDWRIARQFPASCFTDGKCFPIRADANSVTVAIADPLDAWLLSSMEGVIKFRTIKPVLVLPQELKAVSQAYKRQILQGIGQRMDTPHGNDHLK